MTNPHFIEMQDDVYEELRAMLEEWISEGFRSQPFSPAVLSVLATFGVTRGLDDARSASLDDK